MVFDGLNSGLLGEGLLVLIVDLYGTSTSTCPKRHQIARPLYAPRTRQRHQQASPSDLPTKSQLIAGETWRSPVQILFEYPATSFGL